MRCCINSRLYRFPRDVRGRGKQEGANNVLPIGHTVGDTTSMRGEVRIDKSGRITGNGLDSSSDGAGAHVNTSPAPPS